MAALQAPPKLEKPCSSQHFVCHSRHFADDISHVVADNAVEEAKSFLEFGENGEMVKIHFFQEVLKTWSSFRKKLFYFFPPF